MRDLSFTKLTEPSHYYSVPAPQNFNATIAYVLGQSCNLTYKQYKRYPKPLSSSGSLSPGITYSMIGDPFTTSEPIGTGTVARQSVDYRKVPIGFAMECKSSTTSFNVIALRGTENRDEWLKDVEAYPTEFLVGNNGGKGYTKELLYGSLGTVHAGFYNVYTQGTDGTLPEPSKIFGKDTYQFSRPSGSIASYIKEVMSNASFNSALPLYVTGHSLGAALAVLCAMDVGTNFPNAFPSGQLNMYNLAGPLVAAGVAINGITFPGLGPPSKFVENYNKAVHTSYRIVNAADIVPILPPASTTVGHTTLSFEHVTSNNITFCAQTESVVGNHSCTDTYVPYLEQLSNNFNGKKSKT